ncbi:MAG TPA: subclass B3 metallo-beta-lactamase [Thermoanaerobaculia bacterium]|nr:subclass B3 metallo-beta-lactamase [Thermoanaerobaculia bacterium]
MFRRSLLALFFLPVLAAGQADPTSRSWNQPVEPFRIAGNLYYVGASDIASYLIATPEGHILLDGGFVETVPLIRESVKKLGFKIEDVKILLNTHAHYDHAGGLAELKKLTGARLHASKADAPALARGGKDDPLFGDQFLFPPVKVDRLVKDGDTVTLGGSTLTARLTPGHTAGCTTWTMKVDGLNAVIVCSTSVLPMMKLGAEPSYPGIAEDYARTFRTLRALPCDLFLAAHASFYNMKDKAELLKKEGPNPFIDPDGYGAYLDRNEKVFRERLEKDRSASAPPKNP